MTEDLILKGTCNGTKAFTGPERDMWFGQKIDEFRYNAKHLKNTDSYFVEMGCHKCCDNLMHNRQIHEMVGRT